MHVSFDESCPRSVGNGIVFDGACVSSQSILKDPDVESDENNSPLECESIKEKDPDINSNKNDLPLEWKSIKDHPIDNILGDITKGVTTQSKISNFCYHFAFVSQVEPKNSKALYSMNIDF